jgi:hypothetical protein
MLLAQQYNVMFNPGVSGPTATPTATPGGSSWAKTFDDDHNSDHSDWVGYDALAAGGAAGVCTENAGSSGSIEPSDESSGTLQGSCNFVNSAQGSQPSDRDQWGFMQHGDAVDFVGPMLRATSGNMANNEYAYAARCSGTILSEIRICDGSSNDGDCITMGDGTNPGGTFINPDDAILFAVANEDDDTVLCMWVFDSTVMGGLDICNDPEDWGNAMYCLNDDGSPLSPGSKLDDFVDCGGDTVCEGWASTGPDDFKNFPALGQVNVRAYSGSGSATMFSTRTCGGTL